MITNLHIFLSLAYFFLLVAGWLMAVLLLEMFSPAVGKSKISGTLSKLCFYDLEKPGTYGVPNRILRDTGTEVFNSSHHNIKYVMHFK
jgi:hypothetical protein